MAQLEVTTVTRRELDNGILPPNQVLCKVHYDSEGMKTKSGIIVGVLTDNIYNESDNDKDTSSYAADMAETSLIVYKTPEKLYFDPEDSKGMDWETEMQLEPGMMAFTNPIESLNAVTLECEGDLYKIIPYQELYVAKKEKEVVCLNGYVLLEPIYFDKVSEFDVTSQEKMDRTRGKVRFTGKCNTRYRHPEESDFKDLNEGDVAIFDKKGVPIWLERSKYNSFFSETGELFLVIQRRRIAMAISK